MWGLGIARMSDRCEGLVLLDWECRWGLDIVRLRDVGEGYILQERGMHVRVRYCQTEVYMWGLGIVGLRIPGEGKVLLDWGMHSRAKYCKTEGLVLSDLETLGEG